MTSRASWPWPPLYATWKPGGAHMWNVFPYGPSTRGLSKCTYNCRAGSPSTLYQTLPSVPVVGSTNKSPSARHSAVVPGAMGAAPEGYHGSVQSPVSILSVAQSSGTGDSLWISTAMRMRDTAIASLRDHQNANAPWAGGKTASP